MLFLVFVGGGIILQELWRSGREIKDFGLTPFWVKKLMEDDGREGDIVEEEDDNHSAKKLEGVRS